MTDMTGNACAARRDRQPARRRGTARRGQAGFSFIELLLSLGVVGVLGFVALQNQVDQTEKDVAEAFGTDVSLYSQAVAAYIADEGVGVPAGTFTGFDWLKGPACGGSAPRDFVPCAWSPRLPFGIELETEVTYGTGTPGSPCPEPVGFVCAETRITVPETNGQERLDLASEMLHATQGASNAVRSTEQHFELLGSGQLQVRASGSQAPVTEYLRVDGINNMDGALNMGDNNLVNVGALDATGDVTLARFVDRDDPTAILDPDQQSTLEKLIASGDFEATGGGSISGHAVFEAGADIEAASTFDAEAHFRELVAFIGGQTDFNSAVTSTGAAPVSFRQADAQSLVDFQGGLEIVGTGAVGAPCNAGMENMRFNPAGELLECVGGVWQYAGIETRKGTLTYYSLQGTNSYGEFHWAGNGIAIPGRHHICSAQSIESNSSAVGGGARIEAAGSPDASGRRAFRYLAHAGVSDADAIPLRLLAGERTVICLALGAEPVQTPVSAPTNSAPTGSVTCITGYAGEPFESRLSASDRDEPLLYQWRTAGACTLSTQVSPTEAWIERGSPGACTVSVRVTDYYGASSTISRSCTVQPVIPPRAVQGVCSGTVNQCLSGRFVDRPDNTPPPAGWDPTPPPVGDGPWIPPQEWRCAGSNGGASDDCTEGDAPGQVSGNCGARIGRCTSGNAGTVTTVSDPDETRYSWSCFGIGGGAGDACLVVSDHPRPCDPAVDRVDGVCGTPCSSGTYERAGSDSWLCRGACGGNDAECVATTNPAVDGVCGARLDDCLTGSLQTLPGDTWNCLGSNGGQDATGCAVIVNGVCASTQGVCVRGTSSGNTNPWTCAGSGGGQDADCETVACGAQVDSCDVGVVAALGATNRWRCTSQAPQQSIVCEAGLCGDAQDTCARGTSSGNTNPWSCLGSHADPAESGDDARCEVGQCGVSDDATNGCAQGTWEDMPDTPGQPPVWRCLGSVAGSAADDIDCTTGAGVCDLSRQGACAQGTSSGNTNPWSCEGSDPNSDADDDLDCTIGVCRFSGNTVGQCAKGSADAPMNPQVNATNPWTCQGSDGSISVDDDNCEQAVCGIADNASDGCLVGTWRHVAGPTWDCIGAGHGTANDVLGCVTPTDTRCSAVQPGECTEGTPLVDPSNPWQWSCLGAHPDPNVTTDDAQCAWPVCEDTAGACESGDPSGNTNPWTCQGSDSRTGQQPLDRFEVDCVVGVCDASAPGACAQGTSANGNNYEWTCLGSDQFSTRDDAEGCVKAQCNPSGADNAQQGCITGDWEDLADVPGVPKVWACKGSDDTITADDDDDCEEPPVDRVGRCGSADNSTDGCEWGTYDDYDNGGPDWHCRGDNDAVETDDALNCAPPGCGVSCPTGAGWQDNGSQCCLTWHNGNSIGCFDADVMSCDTPVCGAQDNCVAGAYVARAGDGWFCLSAGPNNTGEIVECAPPVNGVCGTADNAVQGCTDGTYQDVSGPGWTCLGSGGGTDASCPVLPPRFSVSGVFYDGFSGTNYRRYTARCRQDELDGVAPPEGCQFSFEETSDVTARCELDPPGRSAPFTVSISNDPVLGYDTVTGSSSSVGEVVIRCDWR